MDSELPSELFIPTKSENRLAHGIRVPCSGILEPTVQFRPIEEQMNTDLDIIQL
jgi:hypothetical protein